MKARREAWMTGQPQTWQHGTDPKAWKHGPSPRWRPSRRHGRAIFIRFAGAFGMMALLIAGGMYALAYLLNRFFGGGEGITTLVWMLGCSLSLARITMAASSPRERF